MAKPAEDPRGWDIDSIEQRAQEFPRSDARADSETIPIFLRRYDPARERTGRVLLVHGASAGSRTFMVPEGGLLRYLCQQGYEVWTLDWRGSNLVNRRDCHQVPASVRPSAGVLTSYAKRFDLDHSVAEDLPWALETIARESQVQDQPLGIVAHCIGGAIVAQAIAQEKLDGSKWKLVVGNVVLTTLALFYRVGLDGWLKGNDYLLETLTSELDGFANQVHPTISPWACARDKLSPWPPAIERLFDVWNKSILRHTCDYDFCHRASFMFGMPYRAQDIGYLHDVGEPDDASKPEGLWAQFGDMPLQLYTHCVQNLRRGFAAPFGASGFDYLRPEPFLAVRADDRPRKLKLITGAENQVWHRDSIDRMYEWVINAGPLEVRERITKHVLSGYGHQDLYWSTRSPVEVYPLIAEGLSDKLAGAAPESDVSHENARALVSPRT